jgi:serine/threonine protein kinase
MTLTFTTRVKNTVATLTGRSRSSRSSRSRSSDLVEHRIAPEEVRLGRKIGEGGFGEVYIATYAKRQVVAKKCKVEALGEEAALRGIEDELDVAVRLRNPSIVQVFGAVFSNEHLLLVMEYCPGGSVRARLDEKPRCTLSRNARVLILGQVAEGLKYLQLRGIVHRDVKVRALCAHSLPREGLEALPPFPLQPRQRGNGARARARALLA